MKGIHVDPVRSTVRAQAGVTVGELNRAAAAFGLAVPAGVVSSTGIAGLTLGGGYRVADGQVRDGRRQPAVRRGGARVGRGRHRRRGRRSRPVLGAARGWGQLRRRDVVRVPRAPGGQRPRRAGVAPARGGAPAVLASTASSPPTFPTSFPRRRPSCTRPMDRGPSSAGSRSATRGTTPTAPRPTSARYASSAHRSRT